MKGYTSSKKRAHSVDFTSTNPINNQIATVINRGYSHGIDSKTAKHINKEFQRIKGRARRVYLRLFVVNNQQPLAECIAVSFPHKAKAFPASYKAPQATQAPVAVPSPNLADKWLLVDSDDVAVDSFPTRDAARIAAKNAGGTLSVVKNPDLI